MSTETESGTAECPECFANVELASVMQNEVVQCRDV